MMFKKFIYFINNHKVLFVFSIIYLAIIILGILFGSSNRPECISSIISLIKNDNAIIYAIVYIPYILIIPFILYYTTYSKMKNKDWIIVFICSLILFMIVANGLFIFVKFGNNINVSQQDDQRQALFYQSNCTIVNTITLAISAYLGTIISKTKKEE